MCGYPSGRPGLQAMLRAGLWDAWLTWPVCPFSAPQLSTLKVLIPLLWGSGHLTKMVPTSPGPAREH